MGDVDLSCDPGMQNSAQPEELPHAIVRVRGDSRLLDRLEQLTTRSASRLPCGPRQTYSTLWRDVQTAPTT
jgi:hypothetical protein